MIKLRPSHRAIRKARELRDLERAGYLRRASVDRCAQCARALPEFMLPTARYCSKACASKALRQRQKAVVI